jgi:hypothetical protein
VLLLMGSAHPTQLVWRHAHLGRLVVPRDCARVEETAAAGIPWAADNAAFSGFDESAWTRMIDAIAGVDGCLFAVAPDVVGDAAATCEMYARHRPYICKAGLPLGWAAQDGAGPSDIPHDAAAVFIGGTDAFKLGVAAREIVATAKRRGLWVHVGRVNTVRRLRYCQSIGADSVDGTKWSRFRDTYLPGGLAFLAGGQQLRLTA